MHSPRHKTDILPLAGLLLFSFGNLAHAEAPVAADDLFAIPSSGITLQVEAFGVLENDTLAGENAGEFGATATLVSGVSLGTLSCPSNGALQLCPDGSFNYSPGPTFNGSDSFTYQALFSSQFSISATVTLTACKETPPFISCWNEQAYNDKLAELGYSSFQEGFEGTPWDIARSPDTALSVISQGIKWTSNHLDTTPPHGLTTGSGAARTDNWGVYDPQHGEATGTTTQCDVDNPPEHCRHHDGFSGTTSPVGSVLHGVAGYITGIYGAKPAIILDGITQFDFGPTTNDYKFVGVIDTSPTGFTHFEIREVDGKIGQALYIWADDFTLAPMIANGDLAPRGAPDGLVNAADYLIALRIVTGQITATPQEIMNGDFSPIGAPDGVIDASDLMLLLRLVMDVR